MNFSSPGATINAHKGIQAETCCISLTRKRCACSAVVTAVQLDRYGRCATCEKVARLVDLHAARGGV